jgi:hypothetical protein
MSIYNDKKPNYCAIFIGYDNTPSTITKNNKVFFAANYLSIIARNT